MTREEQISDAAQISDIIIDVHDLNCFVAGAEWADAHPNWHKYPDEKPDVKDKHSRCFIVALEYRTPDGKPIRISTPALWGDKYKEQGASYIPKEKFYWGPDVFDSAFAWMELPQPPEFN